MSSALPELDWNDWISWNSLPARAVGEYIFVSEIDELLTCYEAYRTASVSSGGESGGRSRPWEAVSGFRDRLPSPFPGWKKRFFRNPTLQLLVGSRLWPFFNLKFRTMLQLFLAIYLALTGPGHSHGGSNDPNHGVIVADTGGETGDIPPNPPPPNP
jgi:hypothetical protein